MMQVDILVLLSQHIGPWSNNWQDHKLSSSLGSLSIRYWSLLCGTLKVPNCWFLFLRVSPRHQRVTRKSGSLFRTPLKCSFKFGKFLFFRMNIFIPVWGIELNRWPLLLSVALWGSEPAWNRGINIERSIWTSRTHHFSRGCGPRTWRTAVLLPSCMFPIQGIPSIKFKGFIFSLSSDLGGIELYPSFSFDQCGGDLEENGFQSLSKSKGRNQTCIITASIV